MIQRAAFAMSEDHVLAADIEQHTGTDFASERTDAAADMFCAPKPTDVPVKAVRTTSNW